MTSNFARASLLVRGRGKSKKKTSSAAITSSKSASRIPARAPGTQRPRKNTTSSRRQQQQASDTRLASQQQQQPRVQGGAAATSNHHYTTGHDSFQQGYAASNSQPTSSVSFRSSSNGTTSQGNGGGYDYPIMSQLTEHSCFSNESSAASVQNSIVPELHQCSQTSTSNNTSRSSSSSFYLRDQSLDSLVVGDGANRQPLLENRPPAATPRRRSWMPSSGAASVMSKMTTRNKSHMEAPFSVVSSSANRSLVVARTGSENVNAVPMILDRNTKPDSAAAASIAQTDTMTTTKEKPNSLITDHFEKLVGNDRDDDKSQDKRDGVFAECEQRLEQKQEALEKLFESKQNGLKALASDIEMQQQDLKKLASEIETKMRGFDDRVEEETTGALARLNAAANDGVDKINRGVESFSKLISDSKDSFLAMAQKLLPSALSSSSQALVPSDTQHHSNVSSSQRSEESIESVESPSIPSTVHVATTKSRGTAAATGKRKVAPKAANKSATDKRTEAKVEPTRASKRLKTKAKTALAMTPKRAVASVRDSKASCVTPSMKTGSRIAPPTSITVTRRTSTKKRLGARTVATTTDTRLAKKRAPEPTNDDVSQPSGGKKARKVTSASKHVSPPPEALSDSLGSSQSDESAFVSPVLKQMRNKRKQANKSRRTYGGKTKRATGKGGVNISLHDCFDFISQESY